MRICIVIGTRPEIIKMSPIIRECEKRDLDYYLVHTNQHYSYNMDRIFFEELQLPEPDYNLEIGSGSHGLQTGKMLTELERIIMRERQDIVLVEGDTNTVLAGALVASKCHTQVGHVEAGLRSYDRSMPEEVNRVLTDHISTHLFAPTEISRKNLLKEGISDDRIHVVGNSIVDATFQNRELAKGRSAIMDDLQLSTGAYFLLTLHRQENVDDEIRLRKVVESLRETAQRFGRQIVYPIHPRTDKMLEKFGLKSELEDIPQMRMIEPVGYLDFLLLEGGARLILTDSGGVQEEACVLNIPCITLRDNTERPETVEVDKNMVVGVESPRVIAGIERMLSMEMSAVNPFGDGETGARIVRILEGAIS